MEFEEIKTQEELERIIEERLQPEREKVEQKYTGYLSPEDFETKKIEYEDQIQEKDKKIQEYELHSVKNKIAKEVGLSFDAIEFLTGKTEDEIKTSAESLKKIMGRTEAPLATHETVRSDKDEALRKTLRKLKGE